MIVHTMPQRSDEWFAARDKCLVTASDMGPWVFKTDATSGKARQKRICEYLASMVGKDRWQIEEEERERFLMAKNIPVRRGNELEDEARRAYEDFTGKTLAQVGLITTDDGLFGASADSFDFIDEKLAIPACYGQGLEIKCPMPPTHVAYLLNGGLPDEYRGQVHGSMVIAERRTWDFWSYCPGFPPLRVTVPWDGFTDDIKAGFDMIRAEYRETRGRLAAIAERHGMEGA